MKHRRSRAKRGGRGSLGTRAALVAAALLAVAASAPESAAPRDAIAVLSDGIFSEREVRELLEGQQVVVRMKEVSERELAIVLACLTPDTPRAAMEKVDSIPHPLAATSDAGWVKALPVKQAPPDLSAFDLGPKGEREARRLYEAEPGYGVNLSVEEIARFAALREGPKEDRHERAVQVLRDVLGERLAGFARAGLQGTPPYARGDGKESRPARELEESYEAFRVRPPLFPRFAQAWNDYPQGLPQGSPEQFFVTRVEVDGRPTVILTHRMQLMDEDRALVAERDFYVSQFFDSALNVVAVLSSPMAEKKLLLFVERVWVDRWNGMVSLKRSAGHRKMIQHVRDHVTALAVCR